MKQSSDIVICFEQSVIFPYLQRLLLRLVFSELSMLICIDVSNALHALNYHIAHAHRGYGQHDLVILLHLMGEADHNEQGFDILYDSLQHHTTLQRHLR